MKSFVEGFHLAEKRWLRPSSSGIFIALVATVVLRSSYLWAVLIAVGLSICMMSLAAKDFKSYWLMVFALVLPLEIKKLLVPSDYIRDLVQIYGPFVREIPGPVLYLSDLPFAVLMIHWLFEVAFRGKKIFFPRSNWVALAFLGWSGVSLANAAVLSYGLFDLLRTVKLYLLYLYVANNVQSENTLKTLMTFLLIGVIFQGVICLYQYRTGDTGYIFGNLFGQQDLYTEEAFKRFGQIFRVTEETGLLRRASGTVGPHNAEAQYFASLLPLAFVLWLTASRFWNTSLYLSILLIGLLGLIVTFSRGGLVGTAAGVTAVFLLCRGFGLISKKKFLTLLWIAVCVCIALAPIGYKYITTRPEAALARFYLAKVGLEMVRAHPFLGVGLNNHMILKSEFDPQKYVLPLPTHNNYILMASEIGIPGLVFFLVFLVFTCVLALRAARSLGPYLASVALGIFGALLALSLHVIFDYLSTHTVMTLLWLDAGLVGALSSWKGTPPEKIPWSKKGECIR
jgi:hypothetical protein